MKIGIDARLAGLQHAGIGRYIQHLIRQLAPISKHEWVLFFFDRSQLLQVLPDYESFTNLSITFAPIKHYSVAEQLLLPRYFYQAKLDLLHIPHFNVPVFYTGKTVITIHDLLWHHNRGTSVTTLPSWQYWLKYLGYRYVTNQAINKAAHVLVPSQTVKQELSTLFPKQTAVTVTYEGVDLDVQTNIKKVSSSQRLAAKKLVFVGSQYPHKNVKVVLEALQLLPKWRLTLIGSRNVFVDQTLHYAKKLKLESNVEWLGRLSDSQLIAELYSATALIQPSISEGFGLTGLEAMAAKCPVIASDIKVFREIYHDAAIYFDPYSTKSLATTLNNLSADNLEQQIKLGVHRVKNFSWQKMANQTLQVYQQSTNE